MFSSLHRIALCLITAALLASPCQADLQDLMKAKGRKILFLGDSNTYAGLYIAYVEGYLRTRFPEEPWELINLGLPSETVSGLSEQDHPYPRPDVHERVDRALAKIKPNIVFICYGMNDGIYSPFSEERLKIYKERTELLVAKIEKAGAKVVLITPSPFDATPIAKNLLPKDAPKFSWMKPYEKYDAEVLRKYSDYLLEWRKKDYVVVDAHAAVNRFLKAMRVKEPKYTVSGDGIHPNPTGHAVIAFEILRELKAPAEVDRVEIDFKTGKAAQGDALQVEAKKDSLSFGWKTKLPMPGDPRWDKRLEDWEPHQEPFNRLIMKIVGLPKGAYEILKSKQIIGSATDEDLANGISLTSFRDFSQNVQSNRLGKLIQDRQQIMGPAWLSDIAYKRPGTPKGLPLDEAMKRSAVQTQEIRRLALPVTIEMTVRKKG